MALTPMFEVACPYLPVRFQVCFTFFKAEPMVPIAKLHGIHASAQTHDDCPRPRQNLSKCSASPALAVQHKVAKKPSTITSCGCGGSVITACSWQVEEVHNSSELDVSGDVLSEPISTIMVYRVLLSLAISCCRQVVVQDLLLTPAPRTLLEPRLAVLRMATPRLSSTTVQCGKLYSITQDFSHILTLSLAMHFLSIRCISAQRPTNLLLKLLLNSRRMACHLIRCSSEIISYLYHHIVILIGF